MIKDVRRPLWHQPIDVVSDNNFRMRSCHLGDQVTRLDVYFIFRRIAEASGFATSHLLYIRPFVLVHHWTESSIDQVSWTLPEDDFITFVMEKDVRRVTKVCLVNLANQSLLGKPCECVRLIIDREELISGSSNLIYSFE